MSISNTPTIVIVGPTASGKTALSIDLAQKYNGEVISADSRAIYRHMDIGTAKSTPVEQSKVRHWGIDLVEPDERFTAFDFKLYAIDKINNIKSRGKTPFLVGGSGLYIDTVIYDYQLRPRPNQKLRDKLNKLNINELHEYCRAHSVLLPENYKNKRYVIRAIETGRTSSIDRNTIQTGYIVVGISTPREVLAERISLRAEKMFTQDIVKETTYLAERYDWGSEPMKSNIYRIVHEWQQGIVSLEEAKSKFIQLDKNLAKRQMTWFRRNPHIVWLDLDSAKKYISGLLENKNMLQSEHNAEEDDNKQPR